MLRAGSGNGRFGGSPFAPARSLDFARDDETKYRLARLGGGARASAPTRLYRLSRLSRDNAAFTILSTSYALRGSGHNRKCPDDFLVLFLRLKKNISFSFVSFLKKLFVTILKVSHSGNGDDLSEPMRRI